MVAAVKERLAGIRKEYEALDTVRARVCVGMHARVCLCVCVLMHACAVACMPLASVSECDYACVPRAWVSGGFMAGWCEWVRLHFNL